MPSLAGQTGCMEEWSAKTHVAIYHLDRRLRRAPRNLTYRKLLHTVLLALICILYNNNM